MRLAKAVPVVELGSGQQLILHSQDLLLVLHDVLRARGYRIRIEIEQLLVR